MRAFNGKGKRMEKKKEQMGEEALGCHRPRMLISCVTNDPFSLDDEEKRSPTIA